MGILVVGWGCGEYPYPLVGKSATRHKGGSFATNPMANMAHRVSDKALLTTSGTLVIVFTCILVQFLEGVGELELGLDLGAQLLHLSQVLNHLSPTMVLK